MKHPLKIIIKKPKQTRGDWAFYREVGRILIEENGPIKTEAQLCHYIYRMFGEGRYQCLAWQKGHEGFWLFWLGNLHDNGFIRETDKNKELNKLKKDFDKASSYEEKRDIEEDMDFERDMFKIDKTLRRRGPIGLIKSPVNQLNQYQDY